MIDHFPECPYGEEFCNHDENLEAMREAVLALIEEDR
jgi:hypothetical protein